MFDKVLVVVAANSNKAPLFTAAERLEMLRECCADHLNVEADVLYEGLLMDYARKMGAAVVVKGLRAVSDFEYENAMALLNRRLEPSVETVFFMTSAEHSFLSSSIVKELGRLGGNISGLVPDCVALRVREKFENLNAEHTR